MKGKIAEQLFNLEKDSEELTNLIVDLPEKKRELRGLLMKRMGENRDFGGLKNPLWWKDGHKLT